MQMQSSGCLSNKYMRQIKFRAWYENKMDYDPYGDEYMCEGTPINAIFKCPLDGQILMQFTGAKDKNGKEIYEGDIVRLLFRLEKVVVKWDDEITGFEPFCDYDRDCAEYTRGTDVEIVGNIYESPDLLK